MDFLCSSIAVSFARIAVVLFQNQGVKVRLVSSDKDATNLLDKQSGMHVQLNDLKKKMHVNTHLHTYMFQSYKRYIYFYVCIQTYTYVRMYVCM